MTHPLHDIDIRQIARSRGLPRKRQPDGTLDYPAGVYQMARDCHFFGESRQRLLVHHLLRALERVKTQPAEQSAFIAAVAIEDARRDFGIDVTDAGIPATAQKQPLTGA